MRGETPPPHEMIIANNGLWKNPTALKGSVGFTLAPKIASTDNPLANLTPKSTEPLLLPPKWLWVTLCILQYWCTVSISESISAYNNNKQISESYYYKNITNLYFCIDQGIMDLNYIKGLTLGCINGNSLNMSGNTRKLQKLKLYGIAKLKTDIIFVADTRISNKGMVSDISNIRKILSANPYGQYSIEYNSSQNKRGTAILIKTSLSFSEIRRVADPEENFLLLLVENDKGEKLILGSIYGPNTHNPGFFGRLKNGLRQLGNFPTILGGDWNMTVSSEPIDNNKDCFKMTNLPNIRHTRLLKDLCEELGLIDPFRVVWPNRKDYTYCPRNAMRQNRSRIDFFIVSENIIPLVTECEIEPFLQSKLFDHKAVKLSFAKNKKKVVKGIKISPGILKDKGIDKVVNNAVLECYLHHLSPETIEGVDLVNGLADVGRVWALIREAGPDPRFLLPEVVNEELLTNRQRFDEEVLAILGNYEIATLQTLPLTISDALFYDTLINNVRNEVSSYQNFVFKSKKKCKVELTEKLTGLKTDYTLNCEEIIVTENKLNSLHNEELLNELESNDLFDILNSEKMTPVFLKLAKAKKDEASLRDIHNSNGEPFVNLVNRNAYITEYFKKLYSQTPEEMPLGQTIEQFLGPEIVGNPIVQASKLREDERMALEQPMSLAELDKALGQCKTGTACGMDGVSYGFLKKYWQLFRVPLYKYCNDCFNNGFLTESFKTAAIKLIPKKGDTKQIKNWRPISLLNCSYKIVSRAINNRLKTVTDRITSRAQKGFTESRYIQEVLINVIENIAKNRDGANLGCVLAIDQIKAFDSVKHSYIEECLNFFGFGPNMINMIKTACFGRKACIIDENGSYSNTFCLDLGTAQGDCPSPTLFNFCIQVLLFKLDLDENIRGLRYNHLGNQYTVEPENAKFALESNRETDKTDAFADDVSASLEQELGNLTRVKLVLDEFANLSGLKCNFEKTNLLPISGEHTVTDEIRAIGFNVVNKINLLGMDIDKDLECLNTVHNQTIFKITNLINFWKRFKLSLPGRIGIAKTLLYSQIGYIGCIITPTSKQLKKLEKLVFEFVKGNLNVSYEKIATPAEKGGLGLFKIDEYICALQVSWLKRADASTRDCWRFDLRKKGNGNLLTVTPGSIDKNVNPILFNLATSWVKFSKCFYSNNSNFRYSFVLNNPIIKRNRVDTGILNEQFLRQQPVLDFQRFGTMRYCDFYNANGIKSLHEINIEYNLNINVLTYMKIGSALLNFDNTMGANQILGVAPIGVREFLKKFKKGSKQIRAALGWNRNAKIKMLELPVVRTYSRVTENIFTDEKAIEKLYSQWQSFYVTNNMREFIFKFLNNSLPINTRVSHFVNDHGRGCTFCTCSRQVTVPDETFRHLFFECIHTSSLLEGMQRDFFLDIPLDTDENRKKFIFGDLAHDKKLDNLFICWIRWTFKFLIWDSRCKKQLSSWNTLKIKIFETVNDILKSSKLVREQRAHSTLFIATNWHRISHAD